MAANNLNFNGRDSKLLHYTPIELKDSTDAYLESCFAAIQQNRYTMDSNTLLQIGQSNKKNKEYVSHALVYALLTDTNNSPKYFHDLLLLNGTNLSSIISLLENLITLNWRRINESVRQQLLWFLRETATANIDGIDRLYYNLLRQINPHEQCVGLWETILEILITNPSFLKTYPEMMLLTIYSYLSIFPIYTRRRSYQQRYIDFILTLARENLHCIGRDGIRLLIQIGNIREIDALLKHLSTNVSNDYMPKILSLQTEPKYLAMPLSFDLERNLRFLLDNCRVNSQEKYYFEWFANQYLNLKKNPDAIYLFPHIIRYVCVVCRNQINSNKVARWTFVLWLYTQLCSYNQTLTTATSSMIHNLSNLKIQVNEQIVQCRLAIFYDWFLFDINNLQQLNNEFDAQLNSTIVGYHVLTIPSHSKQMLLFLLYTSEHLVSSLKTYFQQNVARSFMELFQRIPILNSQQLLQMFTYDRDIYQRLLTTFFSLQSSSITNSSMTNEIILINDDINPNTSMPTSNDEDSDRMMNISDNPQTTSKFSDDEDDDDGYAKNSNFNKIIDHDYDYDDDILMINEETKTVDDIYNTNIISNNFPFDQFRSYINDNVQQMCLSYASSTNRTTFSLLIQIYKQIALLLSDKRPLILHTDATDPPGPITSYSMIKFERTSDKFQSRLLTIFSEQTIVYGLLCLWLLRDSFQNRLLPIIRISNTNKVNSLIENNFREISPLKLKRSIKQSPICVLFRLIKEDLSNQDIYIKLLQSMYFFQPELSYIFLYYMSIDIDESSIAAELFEKFAKDIIKLSTSYRKASVPPAKTPTYDQDFIDFVHETLNNCEQDDTETFLYLFSYVYRLYSKRFLNNIKLIRLLLPTINHTELEQFMCDILKHHLQLFYSHKLYSIVDQTLLFSQIEQENFWKLLGAHDFVQNDYEQLFTNIIEHLLNQTKSVIGEQRLAKSTNYATYRNTIALANVYDILKTKVPTYGLVCCLFAHELTKNFSEKLSLLWHKVYRDVFWRHLERILQKWIQRENDQTKQKVDYKIGTIKMASENGLKYILQHLQILLINNKDSSENNQIDQDDFNDRLTIDDNLIHIPLSTSTIKSLVNFVHKNEQLYQENKTFVDRFENGISILPTQSATTTTIPNTASSAAATTTTTSIKRRKLDNKS